MTITQVHGTVRSVFPSLHPPTPPIPLPIVIVVEADVPMDILSFYVQTPMGLTPGDRVTITLTK